MKTNEQKFEAVMNQILIELKTSRESKKYQPKRNIDKQIKQISKRQLRTFSQFYEKPYVNCRDCLLSQVKCKNCLQKLITIKKERVITNHTQEKINKIKKVQPAQTISVVVQEKETFKQKQAKIKFINLKNATPKPILHQNILELPIKSFDNQQNQAQQEFRKQNSKSSAHFYKHKKNNKVEQAQQFNKIIQKKLTVCTIQIPEAVDIKIEARSSAPSLLKMSKTFFGKSKFLVRKKSSNLLWQPMLPHIKQIQIEDRKKQIIHIRKERKPLKQIKKARKKQNQSENIRGWQHTNMYQQDNFNCFLANFVYIIYHYYKIINFMSFFKSNNNIETRQRTESSSSSNSKSLLEPTFSKIKPNINFEGIQILNKSKFKKENNCAICQVAFIKSKPQNCRICGDMICENDSTGKINNEKACDICYIKVSQAGEQQKKSKIIQTMQILCASLIQKKVLKTQQLQNIRNKRESLILQEKAKPEKQSQDVTIKNLEQENLNVQEKKRLAQEDLMKIQEQNRLLEDKLNKLESQLRIDS